MAKKGNTRHKLSDLHKEIIINMLAAFFEGHEIRKHLKEQFGVTVKAPTITYYKRQYVDEILEARREYNRFLGVTPIANKTNRIRIRQNLVDDLLQEGNLWCHEQTKFGMKKKGNHNHVNKILDSVQNELEPNKIAVTDPGGESSKLDEIVDNAKKLARKYEEK